MATTTTTDSEPIVTYTIYSRVHRRKFPILSGTPPSSLDPTTAPSLPLSPTFYILAPPPWALRRTRNGRKSPYLDHGKWLSILYSGSNPKYSPYPTSQILGISTRGRWFSSFTHQVGGDAPRLVNEKRKKRAQRCLVVGNLWRKIFCRAPKEWEWEDAEDAEDLMGEEWRAEMKHAGHRRYTVEVGGEIYVVTGTRRYSNMLQKIGMKGCALSVKMVRESDHALVATFERTSCGGIKGNRDLGSQLGIVRIFEHLAMRKNSGVEYSVSEAKNQAREPPNQEQKKNEDAVVINILWSMVQAEHLKREKVLEILEEMAQEAGG